MVVEQSLVQSQSKPLDAETLLVVAICFKFG